jgi:hypothetical protein
VPFSRTDHTMSAVVQQGCPAGANAAIEAMPALTAAVRLTAKRFFGRLRRSRPRAISGHGAQATVSLGRSSSLVARFRGRARRRFRGCFGAWTPTRHRSPAGRRAPWRKGTAPC